MLHGRTHGAPKDGGNDGKEKTQKEKSVHLARTKFVERILVGLRQLRMFDADFCNGVFAIIRTFL